MITQENKRTSVDVYPPYEAVVLMYDEIPGPNNVPVTRDFALKTARNLLGKPIATLPGYSIVEVLIDGDNVQGKVAIRATWQGEPLAAPLHARFSVKPLHGPQEVK